MIRFIKGWGAVVLLPAFLIAQSSAYQLLQRPQNQQQSTSQDMNLGDCIDCSLEDQVNQQGIPNLNSPSQRQYPAQSGRYRSPSPIYRDANSRSDSNRDYRDYENPEQVTSRYRIPDPPTEFQRFVQSSTGRLLPIFGTTLFDGVPSTFAPPDRVPTNADYTVGPGDEIELRVWGQVNFSDRLTVDKTGDIFLPQVGRINVSGAKFAQLREIFHSALARIYRNFDLNVNMGQLRSIQIFVLGQARRPGTYTVSSLSTFVNALFASGGPSSRGSLRNIQLKRGEKVLTRFDLYDLLLHGDKTRDVPLMSGDIIFIPDSGPRVAIDGSVESPAIYEFKEDTTLGDIVAYAGGLSPTADGQRAIVDRIDKRATLHSEDIELTASGLGTHPLDGDIIRILSVVPRFERTVALRGNVADPVRRAWHSGMKVSDLIPSKESLLTRGYWHQHNELQKNQLETEEASGPNGTLQVNSPKAKSPDKPDTSYRDESRSTTGDASLAAATEKSDALLVRTFLAKNDLQPMAPDIDWHYAAIERLNSSDLTTHIVAVNLGKIVLEHDASADLTLEPGDVLTVFSNADISVPRAQQTKYVRIEGEVQMAGVYSVQPGETLHDLVTRAGGLTPNAYLFGAQFTRESTRKEQQRRYSDFLDQLESDINQRSASLSGRIVSVEQAGSAQASIASQRALVARLRQTAATGRIVLDLEPGSGGPGMIPRLPLENGDRFFVPNVPSTVNVVGLVYNQAAFLYSQDSRLGDYLKDAGGPSRYADPGRAFVIRADGSVVAREARSHLFSSNFDSLRMYPGDTLVMPTNVSKTTVLRSLLDWSQVIANFGIGAAAVNVLK